MFNCGVSVLNTGVSKWEHAKWLKIRNLFLTFSDSNAQPNLEATHVNHYLTSNLQVQYLWPSILQLILILLSLPSCHLQPLPSELLTWWLFISITIKSLQLNFVKSSSSSYFFVTYHSHNPLQLVFAPILKTNFSQ